MKFKNLISTLTFFLILSFHLSAQISNTEILDHSEHRTILTSFLENKGDIIYVVENDRWGYASTQVKVSIDGASPINILAEGLSFRSDSKWFYDSNNQLRGYIFGLTNPAMDDFSSDFIEIKEENNTYTTNRINNNLGSLAGVISIALDSFDHIYALTNAERLQIFQEGILQDEIFLDIGPNAFLHNNDSGEVFLINNDTIFKANNLELTVVHPLTINITAAKNINNEIWALSDENQLYAYPSDFNGLPEEIPLAFPITTLDQISEHDAGIYIIEGLNEGFKIHAYNMGVLEEVKTYAEDFAPSNKIHAINDSLFLTSGQFVVENIANHAFLRSYHLSQPFTPIRNNVEVEDFDLFYIQDTTIFGWPNDLWLYGINYRVKNLSNLETNLNSIYTSNLDPQLTGGYFLYERQISEGITGNESLEINATRLITFNHPTDITVSVTGSDYKFNENFSPIQVGIITSTLALDIDSKVKIFPNPFSTKLMIETPNNLELSLYNSVGSLVYFGDVNSLTQKNLNSLTPGSYFLKLEGKDELIKLIKIEED